MKNKFKIFFLKKILIMNTLLKNIKLYYLLILLFQLDTKNTGKILFLKVTLSF